LPLAVAQVTASMQALQPAAVLISVDRYQRWSAAS
jgi:hypothetical protein